MTARPSVANPRPPEPPRPASFEDLYRASLTALTLNRQTQIPDADDPMREAVVAAVNELLAAFAAAGVQLGRQWQEHDDVRSDMTVAALAASLARSEPAECPHALDPVPQPLFVLLDDRLQLCGDCAQEAANSLRVRDRCSWCGDVGGDLALWYSQVGTLVAMGTACRRCRGEP